MKKDKFIKIILISVAIFFITFPLRAICDNEEATPDILGRNIDIFFYHKLIHSKNLFFGIFYQQDSKVIFPKSIISYLERQEKSPPAAVRQFV